MKKVLIFLSGAACVVLLLIVFVMFSDSDEECCEDMEQVENFDASQTSASDFYGTGSNSSSDKESAGSQGAASGSKADGKVIHITSSQFKQLVADYTSAKNN